jgi:hypothetical protein
MRGITLVICTAAVTFGALSATHTAGAATITSITYDITGGDFGNLFPAFTGPITGVSVTYTPPGGAVSTPYTCSASYACGRLDFVQTGPSITPDAVTAFFLNIHTVSIDPSHFVGFFSFYSAGYPHPTVYYLIEATAGEGAGHSGYYSYATADAVVYTIGNEIRLPEPSLNLSLASGLAFIGALVVFGGRARRLNRAPLRSKAVTSATALQCEGVLSER